MAKKFESPGYWAVIPAPVRYDDRIPANAKLLYGEITALCDRKGFCWAKNEYFAALFGWSADTVTRLIRKLRDAWYLDVEMVPTAAGSERRIYAGVHTGGVGKNAETPVGKKVGGVSAKKSTPPQYKVNNTVEHTPLTPHGGKRGQKCVHRDAPDWKPDRFAGFWGFYPPKGRKDKQKAIRAWDKLRPDDALIAAIGRALRMLKASEDWQRGVGIPYAATFLNGERWHDADSLPEVHASSGSEEVYGWQN